MHTHRATLLLLLETKPTLTCFLNRLSWSEQRACTNIAAKEEEVARDLSSQGACQATEKPTHAFLLKNHASNLPGSSAQHKKQQCQDNPESQHRFPISNHHHTFTLITAKLEDNIKCMVSYFASSLLLSANDAIYGGWTTKIQLLSEGVGAASQGPTQAFFLQICSLEGRGHFLSNWYCPKHWTGWWHWVCATTSHLC